MKINQKSIETLMVLSSEMISTSKIGDTAEALSSATAMFVLFKEHYNFFGGESYINRDRFVLADPNLSALYYAAMHMFGVNVAGVDVRNYCSLGSKTSFVPDGNLLSGVDAFCGRQGEGLATAVGLAVAQNSLAEKFNAQKFHIISSYTYCFANDMALMNGAAEESASLAGALKLSKLIVLCNQTNTTKDGALSDCSNTNLAEKYRAMGWRVITANGHSYLSCTYALMRAKKSNKPVLIIFKTKAGYKSMYEGNSVLHTRVLNQFEIEKMKADYSLNGAFNVTSDVRQLCMRTSRRLKVDYQKWERLVVLYKNTHPELAEKLNAYYEKPKISLYKHLKSKVEQAENMLEANQIILNALSDIRPCIMGGTADLATVGRACIEDSKFFHANHRGKNINFGSRKLAIGQVCNGISSYFLSPCYASLLLAHTDYALPSIKNSVISKIPVQYIFTHDTFLSTRLGKAYTPFYELAQLRNMPYFPVMRPADTTELLACHSLNYDREKPSALVLSNSPTISLEKTEFEKAKKGAYIYDADEGSEIIIFSCGSELAYAAEVKKLLNKSRKKVALISVPSMEIFFEQTEKYKESVLMPHIKKRYAIEFSKDNHWREFVFDSGIIFGLTDFIPHGTPIELLDKLKLTPAALAAAIK